jgi:hypothetical protein
MVVMSYESLILGPAIAVVVGMFLTFAAGFYTGHSYAGLQAINAEIEKNKSKE